MAGTLLSTNTISSVLYGGAHLFSAAAPAKLRAVALAALERAHGDAATFGRTVGLGDEAQAETLLARVRSSLRVPSMCIDFEDGYGPRPDDEEDGDAVRAAEALASGSATGGDWPVVGIRIRAVSAASRLRAHRTLERFVTTLASKREGLPPGFTVTLPKVETPDEVGFLAASLDALEASAGLPRRSIGVELMIETPRALLTADGRVPLAALVDAADGRCVAAHLGAYDLTAAMGVAANDQSLAHPFCDLARSTMQLAIGDRVVVVDGATTTLPLGDDVGKVRDAWKLHASNVRRALAMGIGRGWDLHPAQLPARFGALHAFYLDAKEAMTARLVRFVETESRAMRSGQAFDDAATGRGLAAFFLRGHALGALTDDDLAKTGLGTDELRARL